VRGVAANEYPQHVIEAWARKLKTVDTAGGEPQTLCTPRTAAVSVKSGALV
jgi:hypothetical protein